MRCRWIGVTLDPTGRETYAPVWVYVCKDEDGVGGNIMLMICHWYRWVYARDRKDGMTKNYRWN